MRPQSDVELVLGLLAEGLRPSEVARRTAIPRSTINDWRSGRARSTPRVCLGHDVASLDLDAYAYLFGLYLGDGHLSLLRRGVWRLRVTLDSAYPDIVYHCGSAIEAVSGGRAHVQSRRGDRAVDVSNYWKHWICLFPQHGPGRKHTRPIVLADWQEEVVRTHVEPFLRGLIHRDGSRIVAVERKGEYVRRAPRYSFSNRSEDILGLFRAACEIAGVHCTRASPKVIAIYSKAAVARLDEFVGPKS